MYKPVSPQGSTHVPVGRMACTCGGHCPNCHSHYLFQAKLNIGQSNDQYERQADAVADRVVNQQSVAFDTGQGTNNLQRKPKPQHRLINSAGDSTNVNLLSGQGEAFSPLLNREIGTSMGYDFSGVRIHRDTGAHLAAKSIGARAFTIGKHIVFGYGEYAPDTRAGKHLLAHELTHVVQQQNKPMLQRKIYTRSGLAIDNYLINNGVNFRKTASHYRGVTVDRTNLDKEILTTMLLSPRNFFVAGTTQQDTVKNLDEHIATRKRIIGYAGKANYTFGAASESDVNQAFWGETKASETNKETKYYLKDPKHPMKAYLDLIYSRKYKYVIACQMATKVTMLAGTNDMALAEDTGVTRHDWIPGDWGYVQNLTFSPFFNDPGEEGENLIYVGNYLYWGHMKPKPKYKTLGQWFKHIKTWPFATPFLLHWRRRPTNGLS